MREGQRTGSGIWTTVMRRIRKKEDKAGNQEERGRMVTKRKEISVGRQMELAWQASRQSQKGHGWYQRNMSNESHP